MKSRILHEILTASCSQSQKLVNFQHIQSKGVKNVLFKQKILVMETNSTRNSSTFNFFKINFLTKKSDDGEGNRKEPRKVLRNLRILIPKEF